MDHVAEALNRLMSQYSGATYLRAIVSALATQSQGEEDVLQDIMVKEIFQTAVGEQLDGWGTILNVPRGSFTDTEYRARLAIKVAQINSEGTIPDLINIFRQMTNAWKTQLVEMFPATIALHAYSAAVSPAALFNLIAGTPMTTARGVVANSGGWGAVNGQTMYVNITSYPILRVIISGISSSTVVIGVTDIKNPDSPTYHRLNPVSIGAAGTYEFDIPAITGLTGNKKIYVNLIIEALNGDWAEFDRVSLMNAAGDEIAYDDDFTEGTADTRPAGWFDSRGGIGALYDFSSIREAITVSKCAGVCIDALTYDTELPAFAFDGFSLGTYPVAGLDDGTGTVGGFLATGF